MFSKHRVEALSDGVFAIAMTLLILEIKVPVDTTPGSLQTAVLREVHSWASFALTFFIASIFWIFQHRVFDLIDGIDLRSVVLTLVTLGFVTVLPFSTALLGHHVAEPVAFAFYFGNQFCIAATLALQLQLSHRYLSVPADRKFQVTRLRLWTMSLSMVSTAIGSLLMPLEYLIFVPIFFSLIGRLLRRLIERKWERLNTEAVPSQIA